MGTLQELTALSAPHQILDRYVTTFAPTVLFPAAELPASGSKGLLSAVFGPPKTGTPKALSNGMNLSTSRVGEKSLLKRTWKSLLQMTLASSSPPTPRNPPLETTDFLRGL